MKHLPILILFFAIFFISSWYLPSHYFTPNPECKTANLIDLTQEELITKLKNSSPSDYRYFFKTFVEEGEDIYMVTNFRNDESCFDVRVLVDKWDKLEGMRRTNGVAYPKELYDLKWEIESVNNKIQIKFVDMYKIID